MPEPPTHFHEAVLSHARSDFVLLREAMTVEEALRAIREQGVGERIIYFYVADADGRLAGVLPTRRLLIGQPDARIADLMVRRVVAIPQHATLIEACELFVLYKFLAVPVVDEERRLVGVVDAGVFAESLMGEDAPQKGERHVARLQISVEKEPIVLRGGAPPGCGFGHAARNQKPEQLSLSAASHRL